MVISIRLNWSSLVKRVLELILGILTLSLSLGILDQIYWMRKSILLKTWLLRNFRWLEALFNLGI